MTYFYAFSVLMLIRPGCVLMTYQTRTKHVQQKAGNAYAGVSFIHFVSLNSRILLGSSSRSSARWWHPAVSSRATHFMLTCAFSMKIRDEGVSASVLYNEYINDKDHLYVFSTNQLTLKQQPLLWACWLELACWRCFASTLHAMIYVCIYYLWYC